VIIIPVSRVMDVDLTNGVRACAQVVQLKWQAVAGTGGGRDHPRSESKVRQGYRGSRVRPGNVVDPGTTID